MTTLAVNGIQAVARGGVRALTQFALSTATSALSRALDNRVFEGPRLDSFHLQTSRNGAPMPRVFGRVRLAGQVIWASQVREQLTESRVGGKGGGPVQRDYSYSISFAVGLCEGEILGVDRIWANGEILPRGDVSIRVYTGSELQGPDPIIDATEPGTVPAFRGTAYLVFEDFPLGEYGGRLPSINAEVVRGVRRGGRMEDLIQSVNLLPGTGEFALSPAIVEETPTVGVTIPTNMNNVSAQADLLTSLDQLQAELPNCRHVNIICAWFGSSTDAGDCLIRPGAERENRRLPDVTWQVAGQDRHSAYIVSTDVHARPNYGGTPSDQSVIACIQTLKQRGFAVTLYPFLLMDMPDFPWRGRITAANSADVDMFFGSDEDFRFRHHILHHARLAQLAGGVDAIVIGSELKALTAFRDGETFPAVDQLRSLAATTKAIVGSQTQVTYAADWSDYFGVQSEGDVRFHLDPLWADPNIDAIGIDAYFPLSDWRDGEHLDDMDGRHIHDADYLRSNVEGGEGYDWYYANQEDRDTQTRTVIDDPVYRYKDLRHWWSSVHEERRDGTVVGQSPWQPRSKPIWLLEIGCPAIDKGANQPNVFYDEKSVDAALPYFSDGRRDDLIQRRYIEAFLGHYSDTNEVGFIDLSRASVWTWDARPYPDFPARIDVWSDGDNWRRGHWLNGRTGLMPVADIVEELAFDSGLLNIDVSGVSGVLPGYVVDRPMSARASLSPLMHLFEIELSESAGQVRFSVDGSQALKLQPDMFVKGPVKRLRTDPEIRIKDVRLSYIDASRDYQLGTTSARQLTAESVAVADIGVPAILDEGFANYVVNRELDRAHAGEETLTATLPLQTGLALEIGDYIQFDDADWIVESLEIDADITVSARKKVGLRRPWVSGAQPSDLDAIAYAGRPQLLAFDLPHLQGVTVGAVMDPFEPVTARVLDQTSTLQNPLRLGATLSPLSRSSPHLYDAVNVLDVLMPHIQLSGIEADEFLWAGNRFAIETALGWEVIAARDIVLVAPQTYRLSYCLRGLAGSETFMVDQIEAGARILWLGFGLTSLPLADDWRGETITVEGQTAQKRAREATLIWQNYHDIPLSPVHLNWTGTTLSWIGRDPDFTHWIEDTSHLRYKITLFRGDNIEVIETNQTVLTPSPFDRAEIVQVSHSGRESLIPATLNVGIA